MYGFCALNGYICRLITYFQLQQRFLKVSMTWTSDEFFLGPYNNNNIWYGPRKNSSKRSEILNVTLKKHDLLYVSLNLQTPNKNQESLYKI